MGSGPQAQDVDEVNRPDRYDAIVLGAGISGLVAAALLVRNGHSRVAVVDGYDRVGGNHIDVAIGPYTFDVGSLIFQDDSPLLAHFPELMDQYVPVKPSWGRLNPQGRITRYPFSMRDDIVAAGPWEWLRIAGSVLAGRIKYREMRNAEDFAHFWVGRRLADRAGLTRYMQRFCGLPTAEIDLQFAQQRMGWIPKNAKLRSALEGATKKLRRRHPPRPVNRQMVRPAAGFDALYAPSVEILRKEGVTFLLGSFPRSITRDGHDHLLAVDGRRLVAPRLISTIPIDHALKLCGQQVGEGLPSVTLLTLFYSFAGQRGFTDAVLYNFAHDGSWKRLTVYSDFYGRRDGREYFAVEVVEHIGAPSPTHADGDFRSLTATRGLLVGDLRLEGHHVLEHAYPIYTRGAGTRAKLAVDRLADAGVESFGRQGAFRYQSTARVSTQDAESALDRASAVL